MKICLFVIIFSIISVISTLSFQKTLIQKQLTKFKLLLNVNALRQEGTKQTYANHNISIINLKSLHNDILNITNKMPYEIKNSNNNQYNVQSITKIPKHIHQFWEGENRPEKLMHHCKKLHKYWQYTLWNVSTVLEMPKLHNKKIFEHYVKTKNGPGMADVARYSILREYGGVYLDADTLCFRSFEPLLKYGFFAGYHSRENSGTTENNLGNPIRDMIANAIIGSTPQHPVIVKVTDELNNQIRGGAAWQVVGPLYLTRVLGKCHDCNVSGDVFILPFHAFVPYHHHEKNILQKTLSFTELPKVKKFRSFAMNLWGTTFNHWNKLTSITPDTMESTVLSKDHDITITAYHKRVTFKLPYAFCQTAQIAVGVLSHISNFQNRQDIRQTWGSNACVYFLVAIPVLPMMSAKVQQEASEYQDLLIIQSDEKYGGVNSSLPLKVAAWFNFVHSFLPQVTNIVKTDDDSYVKIHETQAALQTADPAYWGRISPHIKPNRNSAQKEYISRDMFPGERFPPFCAGAGYALNKIALNCFVKTAPYTDFLSCEDVQTGLVMQKCGILPTGTCRVLSHGVSRDNTKRCGYGISTESGSWLIAHYVKIRSLHKEIMAIQPPKKSDTILKVELRGRLGNQLFLLASGAGIAQHNNAKLCYSGKFIGMQLFDLFVPKCEVVTTGWHEISERGFGRFDMPKISSNSILLGYRQSYKYFENINISKVFRIKSEYEKNAKSFFEHSCFGCTTVGIHVRRGDHLKYQYLRITDNKYFVQAMSYMRKTYQNVMFYVASDDIEWCKKQTAFKGSDVVFLKGSFENDFSVLVACQNMILSLGTFGWWSAFLKDKTQNSDIIYQYDQFIMTHPINQNRILLQDYYPVSWHTSEVQLFHNVVEKQKWPRCTVVGASYNHFDVLIAFLKNYNQFNTNHIPLILYDLGLENNMLKMLRSDFDWLHVRFFNYSAFPSYFDIDIARGEYAWKPIIIKEMLDTTADQVLWLDVGDTLGDSKTLEIAFEHIRLYGYITTRTSGTLEDWVHMDTLKYLQYTHINKPMCNGAIVGFSSKNSDVYNKIVTEWALCSLHRECIAPLGSSRRNHRQDQAVLSVLLHKNGKTCDIAEGHWSNTGKMVPGPLGIQLHQDGNARPIGINGSYDWFGVKYDFDQKRNIKLKNAAFSQELAMETNKEPKYLYSLFGNPNLQGGNRKPPFVQIIATKKDSNNNIAMTIVMPVYNAAEALKQSLPALLEKTSGNWEMVLILDGCYDNSLDVAQKNIQEKFGKSTCQRIRVVVQNTAVWETSCDNLGMRISTPRDAYILIQSDNIITENSWNERMWQKMTEHKNIFAISGRCAHNFDQTRKAGRCSEDISKPLHTDVNMNRLYIRETANRGPLMMRANVTQDLGFLDEKRFFLENDDHDLMRRASKLGYKAGYLPIGLYAPVHLSVRRNPSWTLHIPKNVKENELDYKIYRTQKIES